MYTEKQQCSSITVDQAQKTTKEVKPSHPPTLPLFYKVNSQSLQPPHWRDYGDNWICPKHNFMQHMRVLSCSLNLHISFLSKSQEGQKFVEKNQAGLFVFRKRFLFLQVYFRSKSWQQISWWCVNQSFKYTFYQCSYT